MPQKITQAIFYNEAQKLLHRLQKNPELLAEYRTEMKLQKIAYYKTRYKTIQKYLEKTENQLEKAGRPKTNGTK